MITGQYDEDGYTVFQDGQVIYSAGNSPHDSQQFVEPDDALPVGVLAMFCHDVMVEMAEDLDDVVGECYRVY